MKVGTRTGVKNDRKWVYAFTGRKSELSKLPPLVDGKVDGLINIHQGARMMSAMFRIT
jgi:hypothetical protein